MAATTRLSKARAARLRPHLDALAASPLSGPDPIDFVHRYTAPGDQEVAALIASSLAFGRVASFEGTLEQVFQLADSAGGPAAWADSAVCANDDGLKPVFYRWVRGDDLQRWIRTIGRFRQKHGSLASFMGVHVSRRDADIGPGLGRLIEELRELSVAGEARQYTSLSRGFRHLLPHPKSGSACKRLCMLSRWMTRSDAPDLGLWPVSPGQLVIPLDTHVHRLARLLGLTRRRDSSWRTAAEITRNLRQIDPADPVRYDFALAHLGISGACKARFIPAVCGLCSLREVCKAGGTG